MQMKRVLLALVLFLMAPHASSAQEIKIVEEDLNGDGYVDTLKSHYDGGSMFGGEFVSLAAGRTKQRYEYNRWGSHGQFIRLIPFANALLRPENRGFKEAIEKTFFSDIRPGSIDPSLQWLISAYATGKQEFSQGLFSQAVHFTVNWRNGAPEIPGFYYLVTSDERLFRQYPVFERRNPQYDQNHQQGWLVYEGARHGNIAQEDAPDGYRIYKTAHGVILGRGDRHAWIFVNDEVLMDGPPKLTWPSVKKVVFSNELVFVLHAGVVESLFVVDFKRGVAGRLGESVFPVRDGGFEIQDGNLTVRTGTGARKIDMNSVKRELEILWEHAFPENQLNQRTEGR